jgi:hypothetical protein
MPFRAPAMARRRHPVRDKAAAHESQVNQVRADDRGRVAEALAFLVSGVLFERGLILDEPVLNLLGFVALGFALRAGRPKRTHTTEDLRG